MTPPRLITTLSVAIAGFALAGCIQAQTAPTAANTTAAASPLDEYFGNWPAGTSPTEVGKRVADNFLLKKFDYETNRTRQTLIYPEICAWYGALTFAKQAHDDSLLKKLVDKAEPLFTPEGANRLPSRPVVDDHMFGSLPFELYLQKQDERALKLGKAYADAQWANTSPDGITTEARYWIDDMYMISIVQIQAYRATHDPKYADHIALTMATYLDKMQQPSGLFFHGDGADYYWGRGNGWFAAGSAEVLRDLPLDNPHRARIMDGYKKMMAALLKTQGEDGLWKELIDHPEAWGETSGSAMFTFAMVTGVKNGWLDAKTYGPAARKAWLALVAKLDADANLTDVCVGTNRWTTRDGDPVQFYLNRRREAGNLHGQAPMLWTATALLRAPQPMPALATVPK